MANSSILAGLMPPLDYRPRREPYMYERPPEFDPEAEMQMLLPEIWRRQMSPPPEPREGPVPGSPMDQMLEEMMRRRGQSPLPPYQAPQDDFWFRPHQTHPPLYREARLEGNYSYEDPSGREKMPDYFVDKYATQNEGRPMEPPVIQSPLMQELFLKLMRGR